MLEPPSPFPPPSRPQVPLQTYPHSHKRRMPREEHGRLVETVISDESGDGKHQKVGQQVHQHQPFAQHPHRLGLVSFGQVLLLLTLLFVVLLLSLGPFRRKSRFVSFHLFHGSSSGDDNATVLAVVIRIIFGSSLTRCCAIATFQISC